MSKPTFHIRKPERSEMEYLATMGQELHKESVLKDLNYDMQKVEAWLLSALRNEHVYFFRVITDYLNVPIGGMIGYVSKTYYGHDSVAQDAILMLQKEYRSRCLPELQLLSNMYKEWATSKGAKLSMLGTTTGIDPQHTEQVYEMLGFKKVGTLHAHFA